AGVGDGVLDRELDPAGHGPGVVFGEAGYLSVNLVGHADRDPASFAVGFLDGHGRADPGAARSFSQENHLVRWAVIGYQWGLWAAPGNRILPTMMQLNIERVVLEKLLHNATAASRLIGHLDDNVGGAAVGPIADRVDEVVHT